MGLELSYNRYITGTQAFDRGVIEAVLFVTINDEELGQEERKILESGKMKDKKKRQWQRNNFPYFL